MTLVAAAVCFVVCHPGSAEHFAAFADQLEDVQIIAAPSVIDKFPDRNVVQLEPSADWVADKCAKASVVVTDVGDLFCADVHKTLAERCPKMRRFAYYDNPEATGTVDYFKTAPKVMEAAQKVLFANANLASDPERHIGIGYYPGASKAQKIALEREKGDYLRNFFLLENDLEDQPIAVYFGGCNEEYFTLAFPAFLSYLEKANLPKFHFVFQQHPRAAETNRDLNDLKKWSARTGKQVILSKYSSSSIQVIADVALYHQTSMAPAFALAGIPVIQVAHEKPQFPDLATQSGFPCVTSARGLMEALGDPLEPETSREAIERGLGIRDDWAEKIKRALVEPAEE